MRYNLQSRDLRLFCSVCVSSRLKVIGVGVVHLTLLKGLVVSVSIYLDHRSKLMFFLSLLSLLRRERFPFFFALDLLCVGCSGIFLNVKKKPTDSRALFVFSVESGP
jgi:hypothetical protein